MYICLKTNQLDGMKWISLWGIEGTNYKISCPKREGGGLLDRGAYYKTDFQTGGLLVRGS